MDKLVGSANWLVYWLVGLLVDWWLEWSAAWSIGCLFGVPGTRLLKSSFKPVRLFDYI